MQALTRIYRDGLRTLFDNGSNATICNTQSENIGSLLELFFQKAHDQVVIFCDKLLEELDAPHVMVAAQTFLQRGGKVAILAHQPSNLKFVQMAQKYLNFQLTVLEKSLQVQPLRAQANFVVMDERAFRFENVRGQAKVRLFDPELSLTLLQIYEKMATHTRAPVV